MLSIPEPVARPAPPPLSGRAEALAAARALVPRLRARARQTEADRLVPAESIDEIADAGLFGVVTPRAFGGSELGFASLVEVTAEFASACGSTGWVFGVLAGHSWLLNLFPVEAQREVFRNPRALTATVFRLRGTVERTRESFRLRDGEGRFCSGVDHAHWIIVGCSVIGEDGISEPHFFLVPRSDFEVIDDWFTAGMRGTGSRTIRCTECHIPAHRAVSVAAASTGESPGARFHGHAIYRMPFQSVAPFSLVGAPLGMARAAVRTFADSLRASVKAMPPEQVNAQAATFARLAEATAEIDAAYALTIGGAVMLDSADGPEALDDLTRARFARDWAYAAQTARYAVNRLFEAAGGSGVYDSSELQRIWRDINAASQHFAFTWDLAMGNFGRVQIGLPPIPLTPRGNR